jgi:hypothetical protein
VQPQDNGDLVVTNAQKLDAGEYTCLALNKGGEKESDIALLQVLGM